MMTRNVLLDLEQEEEDEDDGEIGEWRLPARLSTRASPASEQLCARVGAGKARPPAPRAQVDGRGHLLRAGERPGQDWV